jgi:hypothetical protein
VAVARTGGTVIDGGNIYSSTKLLVTWAAPTDASIDHMVITASESIGGSVTTATPDAGATAHTLTDLKSATAYNVSVVACTNAGCTTTLSPSANTADASTEAEYWQLQGAGETLDAATRVPTDGNVKFHAFRYGADAGAGFAGKVQMYYETMGQTKGIAVATSTSVATSSPSSVASFTVRTGDAGLLNPDAGASPIVELNACQGVPLSPAMGAKVRLFFEAKATDGKTRIYYVDSQDGYAGLDFNAGPSGVCRTAGDYGADGGCAPTVVIGVQGDAVAANTNLSNARQFKVGYPLLDDWAWNGADGTFMVFTVETVTTCSALKMYGYAVWTSGAWQVQYDGGCPKAFLSAQAPAPVHLGGVRYKMYYGKNDDQTGKVQGSPLPFLGPKKLLYANGATTGDAARVDFEDWEAQASARDVHFLWPSGKKLSDGEEGYLDDFAILTTTGDLANQVWYGAVSDGYQPPFGIMAALVNP